MILSPKMERDKELLKRDVKDESWKKKYVWYK